MTRRDFIKAAMMTGAALAVPLNNTLLKTVTAQEAAAAQQAAGEVTSTIKGFGQHGRINGELAWVDVQNGRIIRIRSFYYDWEYPKYPVWSMKSHGMTFTPRMHSTPDYTTFGYKGVVYSPTRIMYPLKRVDWDPNGQRNEQNRGRSKYVRISWDEAINILANEIKRVKTTYGSAAMFYYS
jgi:anaerobic selenocysteine-containing dehydrogenase